MGPKDKAYAVYLGEHIARSIGNADSIKDLTKCDWRRQKFGVLYSAAHTSFEA